MGRHGTQSRPGAALIVAACLLTSGAHAEEASAACTATLSGRRVMVRPEARAFISPELDRLVRLGLAGKLEVELTLWKRRAFWFDANLDSARITQVLAFTQEGYVLDGRELTGGVGTLELERVAWTLDARPESDEHFVVQVEVRLQVVTATSLGRMARWLTQGEPTSSGTPVLTSLLRSVAEDLARQASGRCDVSRQP
ncbi:hypothetical protein D7X55_11395 [Corallococcus sp. AB049A]|uniref:DUF4390 domain-containing protein n=1 Tax=Corallococcus interemptor TaxID=2316720 RepID=A0A3A8QZA6_9BACT|nr:MULTISPECIES: hypothetical protein [Corallococcus]RKH47722.1 hypothetical protein D7Y23_21385 [Corallococcus sp. AB050B]RKH71775.1 hypothetical protein D7X96_07575 [Corallococcus interemptor]RKI69212.1 hypothetical protein D7X55_11395 [Corallococcus sp. AB049A]